MLTQAIERISYARVLVEVDALAEPVRELTIQLANGTVISQKVEYEFEPPFCRHCKMLGHKWDNCSWNPVVYNTYNHKEAPRVKKRSLKLGRETSAP